MTVRTLSISLGICAGLMGSAGGARAATPVTLAGGILGHVQSSSGVAQMGATVLLYNRYDQLVRQALTNEQGRFAFDALLPDLYSLRVTLASFMPALRKNIAVAAGSENVLQINLASVLSTVELVSSGASRGTLMSDDWKWVLRSSHATRPVLRLLPDQNQNISRSRSLASMFSETTGVVKLSAGDAEDSSGAVQQDVGTAFAVATAISERTRVQLAGNLGYLSNSGIPVAGVRARYSRGTASDPGTEATLTMRQLFAPTQLGSGTGDAAPGLRTMSLAVIDHLEVMDGVRLEYGFNLESVSFLTARFNHVSPFARATYDMGRVGSVRIAYSSGTQPTELRGGDRRAEPNAALENDLAALALLPRVSLRGHDPRLQRTETFEVGFQHVEGSRTYSVGAYRDGISNASYLLSAGRGFLPPGDLLPDLASRSRIFNIGNFERLGYTASVAQTVNDHLDVTLSGGRSGALVAGPEAVTGTADELRGEIGRAQRTWLTARASAKIPGSGTQIVTCYGWTDFRALTPTHVYLTQNSNQEIGWNLYVRQPLPALPGMPGRIEATADLRNMLAQGYLPLAAGGRSAMLVNAPRALRGGLNFIF